MTTPAQPDYFTAWVAGITAAVVVLVVLAWIATRGGWLR